MTQQVITTTFSPFGDILNSFPGLGIAKRYGYKKEITVGSETYECIVAVGDSPTLRFLKKVSGSQSVPISKLSLVAGGDKEEYRHDIEPLMSTGLLIHTVLEFWKELNKALQPSGIHIPHPSFPKQSQGYTGY